MKNNLLILFFCCSLFHLPAQNLIPNPGFDKHLAEMEALNKGERDERRTINNWDWNPKYTLYYRAWGSMVGSHAWNSHPRYMTNTEPISKKYFLGVLFYKKNNKRGFVSVKLKKPLVKEQTYYVEMYVQLAFFSSLAIKEIPVLLSAGPLGLWKRSKLTNGYLNTISGKYFYLSLKKEDGTWIDDKKWCLVSTYYKAKGDESYITLGNPQLNSNTPHIKVKEVGIKDSVSNYHIDDVSLIEYSGEYDQLRLNKPLVLKNVLFKYNKSSLLNESKAHLNILANYLIKNPNFKIQISGHTDNTGNTEKNIKLSENRAKSVVGYLISKGIEPGRLSYKGYGANKPIADNLTEHGKKENRRVEIRVLEK